MHVDDRILETLNRESWPTTMERRDTRELSMETTHYGPEGHPIHDPASRVDPSLYSDDARRVEDLRKRYGEETPGSEPSRPEFG